MSRLLVLSEDIDIVPYLNRNGLYPNDVLFTTNELCDQLSFLDEDDMVLVIIHGFSRFTLAEMLSMMHSFSESVKNGATFKILSDVLFKSPDAHTPGIEFIQYKGDLFFGEYTWFSSRWRIARNTVDEDAKIADFLNGRANPDKVKNTSYRQDFWNQFGEFTDPSVKPSMGVIPTHRDAYVTSDSKYMSTIMAVDLFNK